MCSCFQTSFNTLSVYWFIKCFETLEQRTTFIQSWESWNHYLWPHLMLLSVQNYAQQPRRCNRRTGQGHQTQLSFLFTFTRVWMLLRIMPVLIIFFCGWRAAFGLSETKKANNAIRTRMPTCSALNVFAQNYFFLLQQNKCWILHSSPNSNLLLVTKKVGHRKSLNGRYSMHTLCPESKKANKCAICLFKILEVF